MSSKSPTLLSRVLKSNVFLVFAALVSMAVMTEVALRILPTNESLKSGPVDDEHPILKNAPNRTVKWSRFWNFSERNVVHVNNDGFLNNFDYMEKDPRPLLSIVGDSFVEASMVPWEETGAGRLGLKYEKSLRIYSFGTSGAPFSHYLMLSEYARKKYKPEAMVILVIYNDFDESLLQDGSMPGLYYFKKNGEGKFDIVRKDRRVSPVLDFARNFATAMYLLINLDLPSLPQRFSKTPGVPAGELSPSNIANSKEVSDEFLRRVEEKSGLTRDKILFVVEGVRGDIYNNVAVPDLRNNYFHTMRTYFMEQARAQGFEVADMQPLLREQYLRDGRRFEFPLDFHWNGLGHEVFARAIEESNLFKSLKNRHKISAN